MSYVNFDGTVAAETPSASSSIYGASTGGETLTGTAAPTALWGQGPRDLLVGLSGSDTFYFQASPLAVTEVSGGSAQIVIWASTNLGGYANIANLSVGGGNTYAAGDGHNNIITATGSTQQLYGGAGQDVLVGNGQTDTFIVLKGQGNDAIYGFNTAHDTIRLTAGYSSFDQVQAPLTQVGADVKLDLGGGDGVVIRNLTAGQLTAANFQLQLDGAKLGGLTFDDEFSSKLSLYNPTYNPTGVWRPDYGYAGSQGVDSYTLTGNGEQQIYTSPYFRDHAGDFTQSPFVSNSDGTLSIIAQPSTSSEIFGYHYTSGMISTKQTFAQTYGYFEMRAELPHDSGGWPAFWLAPADGSWPPELDVMETLSKDPNADYATAHSNATGVHTMSQGMAFIPDTADGFHSYGVLWTKTDLTWYVDGVEVFHAATPADMNKPMYMIANLALGGWGGAVDDSQLPAQMKIDDIHAYSLADGSSTVVSTLPAPTPPPPPPSGGGAPDAPTGLADSAIVGGYVNAARDVATQVLSGTAEAGSTVTVYDGAAKLGSASASSAGAWSYVLGRLADGGHSLTATATDAAGNVGPASGALGFTVDTQMPTPSVGSAVYGAASRTATISGVSEPGSTVKLLDQGASVGSAKADASGAWSIPLRSFASGTHVFTESATDLAGNTGSSTTTTLYNRANGVRLTGATASETFIGNPGDTMTGGGGHDTFAINPGFGRETIRDFIPSGTQSDVIAISHTLFSSFAQLMQHATQSGTSTLITYDAQDVLILQNTKLSSLQAADFLFT
ncbi:MAG: endo,3,4-beta-glycanase, C-terminal secretion signal protein [Phenylobacterium sp.]|nr:endo,3,4-beta-glycanase, C-terminal secretion signal protein [Phenylobacterium sp.]